jgi:small subunit ribosomal protein S11
MGKTKIVTEKTEEAAVAKPEGKAGKTPKKKITSGVVYVDATFNNTKVLFADKIGNAIFWSTAGSLGFRGAKKGTPFAAGKVGDLIGGKMVSLGVADTEVVIRGVGSGRDPVDSLTRHRDYGYQRCHPGAAQWAEAEEAEESLSEN